MEQKNVRLFPAVLATGIMSFAGVLIETAMNVTFPTLTKEFGVSTGTVQWVTTIYLLVISIMVPLSNYLLKTYSLRRLFIVANLFFLIGLAIDVYSPSFSILLLGRLFQGASTGIALPLMFHIILNFTPLEKRGTMMGVGTLTTSIAPAIGPTYGGILTSSLSWHAIFLFLIPVLLLSLFMGLSAIPEIPVKKTTTLDLVSLIGIALLFSGLLMFLSKIGTLFGWLSLLAAVIGFVIFYKRATTGPESVPSFFKKRATPAEQPLVRLTILKNPAFVLFLCGFLVCQFLLLGISFVLPNFVQIVLGKNAFVAGLVMLPGATVGAILAPLSGRVLDQYGAKKPILFGLSLATIGWLALTILLEMPVLLGFVAGHVTYMIGLGFAYSNMMTTGMSLLEEKDFGDGNTLFNTLQQFSGAIATAIVATIINIAQDHADNFAQGTTMGSLISLIFLLTLLVIVLIACWNYFRKKA